MRYDFGIDPDFASHGVAVAIDKKLVELKTMTLYEIVIYIQNLPQEAEVNFHIEDVTKQKAVFADKRRTVAKTARNEASALAETARKIGMMQGAASELIKFLESMKRDINIRTYPISSAWKDPKAGAVWLERVWGYKGRSNKDTRSAAYFLSLGCR